MTTLQPAEGDGQRVVGSHGADDFLRDVVTPPHRDPIILREQVLIQLRRIVDPDLHRDIVSLGFIKNLTIDYDAGKVSFTLELTTPACPVKEEFVEEATTRLKELGWVMDVDVTLTARQPKSKTAYTTGNLSDVGAVIAVASCKGGVGKSTIACNLAFMLKRQGARVGLVDADVYGPSLPSLLPLPSESSKVFYQAKKTEDKSKTLAYDKDEEEKGEAAEVKRKEEKKAELQKKLAAGEGGLVPLEYEGVKLMSYGYLKKDDSAFAAVRGPLASSVVYQMVTSTLWGPLDYLVIDLPPGTGDIHLTLVQGLKLDGAVVVTTPQQLSIVDVEKGIAMFDKVGVPTLSLVENMATFECPCCHTTTDIFSKTSTILPSANCTSTSPIASGSLPGYRNINRLVEQFGLKSHVKLPLHPDLAALRFEDEKGNVLFPLVLAVDQQHSVWRSFRTLAAEVAREVSSIKFGGDRSPDVTALEDGMLQVIYRGVAAAARGAAVGLSASEASELILHVAARRVRLNCRCAECVDEFTGRPRINPRKVPPDVHVVNMRQAGDYAVSIDWSDGHHSIISFQLLENLCEIEEEVKGNAVSRCVETAELAEKW